MIRLPFGIVLARDPGVAVLMAGQMFDTRLTAKHIRNGKVIKEYDLGSGMVTTAGVNFLAADFAAGASDINLFKYHDCGTGSVAAAISDTALGTPYGGARATGSQASATNVYTTVGTISFTSTLAITEWGLFSATTVGTLWDRRVFAAINVVNGDSIQFTYNLTCTAGG